MKIAAITRSGSEFIYRSSTAHQVPVSSGQKIIDALNKARHGLKDGEVWHLYDVDRYDACWPVYDRFYIRSGSIYEGRCNAW